MDTLLRWNFNVWNNCRAFLFPSSDIQFYHFMKHVTTMGKKNIMLTFDMLDWDADGEIGFEEFYMMVCILLSSEVRHSLTKHDHIKNSPSTFTTTIRAHNIWAKSHFLFLMLQEKPIYCQISSVFIIVIVLWEVVINVTCAELCMCT